MSYSASASRSTPPGSTMETPSPLIDVSASPTEGETGRRGLLDHFISPFAGEPAGEMRRQAGFPPGAVSSRPCRTYEGAPHGGFRFVGSLHLDLLVHAVTGMVRAGHS